MSTLPHDAGNLLSKDGVTGFSTFVFVATSQCNLVMLVKKLEVNKKWLFRLLCGRHAVSSPFVRGGKEE